MRNPMRLRSFDDMTTSAVLETIQVLLIEDGPGDVRLMQEALRGTHPSVVLHVVKDGVEAMAYLRRGAARPYAPRPDLILLDLNLPKMDGRDVLACIKEDPRLKSIPVIVLTVSDAPEDMEKCYRLQANCYLTKPSQFDDFENLVKSIHQFWLKKVQLPKHPTGN